MSGYIENSTFDEIEIGDTASLQRTLTYKDIQLFAVMSGDINPVHVDAEFAESDMFHQLIAHGMWTGSLISTLLGTQLPGPGAIYLNQTFQFLKPVVIGDVITARVTVTSKDPIKKYVYLDCICINQIGKEVMKGVAHVIAPFEKVRRKKVILPNIEFMNEKGSHYHRLISLGSEHEPLGIALVHPVDKISLESAVIGAQAKLIKPILVGPENKIKKVAQQENIDITKFVIESTPHSHAAAERAVQLAREGKVEAIMKGAIHTDELLHPMMDKVHGLRTGRRMSHISVMDIPGYSRLLFITDAALNMFPKLSEKVDIVQNAIDLFHSLKLGIPKVAILSAIETVNEKIPSTLDATALCKMAERGQIIGGILDGPLAFDNALSQEAAEIKHIHSQVAGGADILVVPDIEAGNILLKQLSLFSNATMAGLVMGARVPIILTSRSSNLLSRQASCALALLAYRNFFEKQDK